jgi:outer membrane lipoprotein SlyB
MRRLGIAAGLLASVALGGCATTTTTTATWTAPPAPARYAPAPPPPLRPALPQVGRVEAVKEIVRRREGNPGAGAVLGAAIGGLLFHWPWPAAIAGAAGGAAIGAAASQGGQESRTYQVLVRFYDGTYGSFFYGGYSPFWPGEPVVLTPQGLARAG